MKIKKKEQIISLSVEDIKKNCNLYNAFTREEVIYMCNNKDLFKLEKGIKTKDGVIASNCYAFLGREGERLYAFIYFDRAKELHVISLYRMSSYILQIKI